MKLFLISCILCIVGVQNAWGVMNMLEYQKGHINWYENGKECAKELDVPAMKPEIYLALESLSSLQPEINKVTCMSACLMRKMYEDQNLTMLGAYLKAIDEVYQFGNEELKPAHIEAKAFVLGCYSDAKHSEHSECKFYKCLGNPESPLTHMVAFALKPALRELIRSKFH